MTDTAFHPQAATSQQTDATIDLRTPPANASHHNEVGGWPPAQPPVPPAPPASEPAAASGPAPRRPRRRMLAAALAAALVVGGGVAGGAIGAQLDRGTGAVAATTSATGSGTSSGTAGGTAQLADVVTKVAPSIVTVVVNTGQGTAEGSGIVLSADGLIVTNNHVVEPAAGSGAAESSAAGSGAVRVTLASGRTVVATVLGRNPTADLAVLRVRDTSGLTPATLGRSSTLQVGDAVLAFGSPLGLAGTVTSGIVSALDRSISDPQESLSGLVQTDAAINPGNSGGALVDTAGRIVGVNVAIATTGQDSGNIGVGFAIPVDTVRTVVSQLVGSAR